MTGAHGLPEAGQPDPPGIVRSSDGLGVGALTLPKLDGREVSPGVWLIGEPSPVAGTDKMRCLANVGGALALVELRLRFLTPNVRAETPTPAQKE